MSESGVFSDKDLVEKTKNGDDRAYSLLMTRYMSHVFNFAKQYIKDEADTEDIVQDSFFKAWKHIKTFDTDKNFRPWLFTIVRNTALDHIKKKKDISFSQLDPSGEDASFTDTLPDLEPLPSEIFENKQLAENVEKVIDLLHPDQKVILLMHYQENMTFHEISDVMNIPLNTIKSWHRRALTKIRSSFLHQIPK